MDFLYVLVWHVLHKSGLLVLRMFSSVQFSRSVVSNDGDLVNRLTHPRFEHAKTYVVKTAGRWSREKLATLRSPITLDDGYTIRPVPVEVLNEGRDNTQLLKFVLKEGRKRQIRKMCSAAHLVVLSLKRVAVGSFSLPPELKPGEWRDLSPDETAALMRPTA